MKIEILVLFVVIALWHKTQSPTESQDDGRPRLLSPLLLSLPRQVSPAVHKAVAKYSLCPLQTPSRDSVDYRCR